MCRFRNTFHRNRKRNDRKDREILWGSYRPTTFSILHHDARISGMEQQDQCDLAEGYRQLGREAHLALLGDCEIHTLHARESDIGLRHRWRLSGNTIGGNVSRGALSFGGSYGKEGARGTRGGCGMWAKECDLSAWGCSGM